MARFNPKYKIDVVKVFERAYRSESSELRNKLRPLATNESVKFFYANLVVDEIVKRTESGIDKKGQTLGTYSKEYKESFKFQVNKGAQSTVNLKLTGFMLSDIRNQRSRRVITFNLGSQLNRNKAQGHITGRYGKNGRSRERDFLGLPKDLEEKLLKDAIKSQSSAGFQIDPEFLATAFSSNIET